MGSWPETILICLCSSNNKRYDFWSLVLLLEPQLSDFQHLQQQKAECTVVQNSALLSNFNSSSFLFCWKKNPLISKCYSTMYTLPLSMHFQQTQLQTQLHNLHCNTLNLTNLKTPSPRQCTKTKPLLKPTSYRKCDTSSNTNKAFGELCVCVGGRWLASSSSLLATWQPVIISYSKSKYYPCSLFPSHVLSAGPRLRYLYTNRYPSWKASCTNTAYSLWLSSLLKHKHSTKGADKMKKVKVIRKIFAMEYGLICNTCITNT